MRNGSMSDKRAGTFLPILALSALLAASAPAPAADDDRLDQGPQPSFGTQPAGQSSDAAPRIYIPLHQAQPREVEKEFAPIQATAFGRVRSGQTPSDTAAGKLPARGDFSVRVGKNNGMVAPPAEVPNGG